MTFIIVAVQIGWFVLCRAGAISRYTAIGLLLLTCGVAIWLQPYFSPMRLAPEAESKNV